MHKVGPKGQVVIAKEIRDRLGIGPGWQTIQRLVDGHVEIHFLPPEHDRSLFGVFAKYAEGRFTSEEEREQAEETAWEQAVKEEWERAEETAREEAVKEDWGSD